MDWNNVMTVHRGVDEVDAGQFDRPGETEVVAGTAMFVRQAVFAKIGLFDEKYFLYFEESDFCRRARAAGFTLWYEPKAVLWHRNARSSGVGSDLHDYYTTRNRLLFGMRYAPWRAKLALLRQAMNLYFHGRKWQKQGVADFFLARLGPGTFPL
jgi:GT2 family glycosyltransferase